MRDRSSLEYEFTRGRRDALAKFALDSSFKPVAPPKPPQIPQIRQQKAPELPKLPALPVVTPQPQLAPLPQTNPAAAVSAAAHLPKVGEFNFEMTPRAKSKPGEIRPDNGRRTLGTNFNDRPPYSISRGFDALKGPHNPDPLDIGEQTIHGGIF